VVVGHYELQYILGRLIEILVYWPFKWPVSFKSGLFSELGKILLDIDPKI